jgi:glycosyltransferase involved in cell wall biosynthesis
MKINSPPSYFKIFFEYYSTALRQGKLVRKVRRDIRLEAYVAKWAAKERPILRGARQAHPSFRQDQEPLVSVTIPTYNRGLLLAEQTIPSVLAQTYPKFEIVVVGDACTDDTGERLARIGDPRIRYYNLPERGKYPEDPLNRWRVAGSTPINKALELAQGEWVAYLDDDDVFMQDHIEVLLKAALQGDYELVFGMFRGETNPGEWVVGGEPRFPNGHPPFKTSFVPHSSVMYRSYLKFMVYDIDAWKYEIAVDNLLWQRMGRIGVRAGFLNQVVCSSPLRPDKRAQQVAFR